jgi:hypothetical protein
VFEIPNSVVICGASTLRTWRSRKLSAVAKNSRPQRIQARVEGMVVMFKINQKVVFMQPGFIRA